MMARFDVYANPEATERKHTPYFLDVQNPYIEHLASRVMVPLRREAAFGPRPHKLNPLLAFGADAVVLDTAALGAVPLSELRAPVGHLRDARAEILQALDTLFGAY
jgi:toxin CcdB